MGFAGIRRPTERADVIAYLNTLSDNPKPLPKPTEGAAAPAAAPATAPAPAPAKH
jgi:cytochrome c